MDPDILGGDPWVWNFDDPPYPHQFDDIQILLPSPDLFLFIKFGQTMTPNFELLENNVTSLSSHFWIIFYPTNIAGILISWRSSHGLRFLDLPQEGLIPQPLRAGRTVSGQGHWDTGTLGCWLRGQVVGILHITAGILPSTEVILLWIFFSPEWVFDKFWYLHHCWYFARLCLPVFEHDAVSTYLCKS